MHAADVLHACSLCQARLPCPHALPCTPALPWRTSVVDDDVLATRVVAQEGGRIIHLRGRGVGAGEGCGIMDLRAGGAEV